MDSHADRKPEAKEASPDRPRTILQSIPRPRGKTKEDEEPRKTDRAFQKRAQLPPDHPQAMYHLLSPIGPEIWGEGNEWIMNRYYLFTYTSGGKFYGLPPDVCLAITRILDRLRLEFRGKKLPAILKDIAAYDWLSEEDLHRSFKDNHHFWRCNVDKLVQRLKEGNLTWFDFINLLKKCIRENFERRWFLVTGGLTNKSCKGGFDSAVRTATNNAFRNREELMATDPAHREHHKWVRSPGWSEKFHDKEIVIETDVEGEIIVERNGVYRLVQIKFKPETKPEPEPKTCGKAAPNV